MKKIGTSLVEENRTMMHDRAKQQSVVGEKPEFIAAPNDSEKAVHTNEENGVLCLEEGQGLQACFGQVPEFIATPNHSDKAVHTNEENGCVCQASNKLIDQFLTTWRSANTSMIA